MTTVHNPSVFNFFNWVTYKLEARRIRQARVRGNKPLTENEKEVFHRFLSTCRSNENHVLLAAAGEMEMDRDFEGLRELLRL